MELCDTCNQEYCNKNIIVTKKNNLTIIKCLDYQKDTTKIKRYIRPLMVTAKRDYIMEVEL